MELFALQCFVAVAREESFSKAAEKLFRTQPAVSLQVQKLEDEIKQRLFDRSRKKPVLTQAGRALFSAAGELMDRVKSFQDLAASTAGTVAGTLTIASNASLLEHFLPGVLKAYHAAFPLVRPRILSLTSRGIARAVQEREAEVGIGFLPKAGRDVTTRTLRRSAFLLVSPPGSALGGKHLTRREILDLPLVHFEPGVEIRTHVERGLGGGSLEPVLELPTIGSILRYVEYGFGCSILPDYVLSDSRRAGLVVRRLGGLLAPLDIRLCFQHKRPLSKAAEKFIDILGSTIGVR
jgi:DNA-binding transcriptional LysR family regulator